MLFPMMRERLLTALAGTPEVLDGLLATLPPDDPRWDTRPDPDRFTLREILAHLVDYEAIFSERIRQTREENAPNLLPADRDQLAIDHHYAHSDPTLSRAQLAERRTQLVAYLKNLSSEDWQRIGHWTGPSGGPLTLEEQAAFVVIHDGYHLQQVVRWMRKGG